MKSANSNNIMRRLLRRNLSAGQLGLYALAMLTGLTIVMLAIQFYRDVSASFDDSSEAFINRDYLVLSPDVSAVNSLLGGRSNFSDQDVEELQAQPWARRVGRFTRADFNVTASVSVGLGNAFSTALFFESVPDEFFDVRPQGWEFSPAQPKIPVILSRDYLTLYNFGFAATRGLPQLSEGIINKVPLSVTISGNGRTDTYPARIVGFSSRLNTIAVPESFMKWANDRYGSGIEPEPGRLIVDVTDPGSERVQNFLRSRGYMVAGDKAGASRASHLLSVVTAIVMGVGTVISLLALFILLLSLTLLLQKNRRTLVTLMHLGYSPRGVAAGYLPMLLWINGGVLIISGVVTAIAAAVWQSRLGGASIAPSSLWPTLAIGLALAAAITAAGYLCVLSNLRRNFK